MIIFRKKIAVLFYLDVNINFHSIGIYSCVSILHMIEAVFLSIWVVLKRTRVYFFLKKFIPLSTSYARPLSSSSAKGAVGNVCMPSPLQIPGPSQIGQEHWSRAPWLGTEYWRLWDYYLAAGGKGGRGGGVLGTG